MTDETHIGGGPPEDDDVLAGEFALGLLSGAEAAAVARRVATEPGFARRVADWRETLATLDAETDPVTPPAELFGRIEGELFGGGAAAPGAPRRAAGALRLWLAGLAAAAAVVVLAFYLGVLGPGPAGALETTVVADADASVELLHAAYDPEAETIRFERLAVEAPPGRVLQLWATDGDALLSLGLFEGAGPVEARLPEPFRGNVAGLTLGVSHEPPGGSPTGAPTEVIGHGTFPEA